MTKQIVARVTEEEKKAIHYIFTRLENVTNMLTAPLEVSEKVLDSYVRNLTMMKVDLTSTMQDWWSDMMTKYSFEPYPEVSIDFNNGDLYRFLEDESK